MPNLSDVTTLRPPPRLLSDTSCPPASVRTVALIPARGGSKGIPGKNLRTVAGVSLVERAVRACRATHTVDAAYVSTDDPMIAAAARRAGAEVVDRPAELAGDRASSEAALLHALDELSASGVRPQSLLFVQCTSPFLDPADLDQAVALLAAGRADSVFSAVPSHRFLWRPVGADHVTGVNHDPAVRLRRQDRSPEYLETGAFYGLDVSGFRAHGRRFFGRTQVVPVAELTALEIDTPADLALAEALAALVDEPEMAISPPAEPVDFAVDAVITDFDGVHTDDAVTVDQHGVEAVRVSRTDGLGVAQLTRAGVPLLIVSTETNPVVGARAAKLGVEVRQGVADKASAVRAWLTARCVPSARAAYLGNDVNDLAAMGAVGWPVAVADARPEVRRQARLVLNRPGGHGAVRELCDLVLATRAGVAPGPAAATAPNDAQRSPAIRSA